MEEHFLSPSPRVEGHVVSLAMEQTLSMGLVLNELATNCLKHALPSACQQPPEEREIPVFLRRETGWIPLEVTGSGVGLSLDPGLGQHRDHFLGMRILDALGHQREGTFQMGTTCPGAHSRSGGIDVAGVLRFVQPVPVA